MVILNTTVEIVCINEECRQMDAQKKRTTYHPTEPTTKTTADAADNDDDTM